MTDREKLTIELPYPPTVNRYWRLARGHFHISNEGQQFRQDVVDILSLATHLNGPLAGDLDVHVDMFPPDHRRRDVDNVLKALLDALEHGGAYGDDNQIVNLSITKRGKVKGGKTVVAITSRRKRNFMLLEEFLTKHRPCGRIHLLWSCSQIVCIECNELRGVTCDGVLGEARKFICDCDQMTDDDPCKVCGGGRF